MKIEKIIKKAMFGLSLCTILGMNVDVYAGEYTVASTLPDTVQREFSYKFQKDPETPTAVADPENASSVERNIARIDANNNYILYCSDMDNNVISDEVLTKSGKLPYGIAYILKNSYPQKTLVTGITGTPATGSTTNICDKANDMANIWITQAAIWGFQGKVVNKVNDVPNGMISNGLAYDNLITSGAANTACETMMQNGQIIVGSILWNNYVQGLIDGANSVKDPAESTLSVSVAGTWTKDGEGQRSGLITVEASSTEANYSSYSLSLVNAPNGTKVYSESGNEITDLSSIPAGTKLYVTVPKIDKDTTITVKANTTITYDQAYQYVSTATPPNQPSVLVGPESKEIAGETTLIPDTASSISTSIYFIGLIILLSGAGMIYANVKTKKQES